MYNMLIKCQEGLFRKLNSEREQDRHNFKMNARIDSHLQSFKLRVDTDVVKGRLLRATKAFSTGKNLDVIINFIPTILKKR